MNKKIFNGALILAISSVLSRVLGVVRDHLFSDIFGATGGIGIFDLDTYYAAFRIPDTIFNLLIYGTISTAFVPIFTKYINKKDKEPAWIFANNVLNILVLVMTSLAIIAFIFSKPMLMGLFPGFSVEKIAVTTQLMRIMLVSPIIFGISSFAQSIQNSFKTFTTYALAPVLYNLGIILVTYFWGHEHGVYAITYGVVLGAILHLGIQIPSIFKLGFRYRPVLNLRHNTDIKQLFKLIVPRIMGVSVVQINLIFDHFLASLLFTGSLAVFNYAYNLNSLPLGVIGISFAVASFSLLTELVHNGKTEEFKREISRNVSAILILVIPGIVGLIVFRQEIVNVILGGDSFNIKDKILTANTLAYFSIGLFAHSLVPLLGRSFYSLHNTKTPFYISVGVFIANIIFSLTFVFVFNLSIYGLALSNSCAGILNFALLTYFLRKQVGNLQLPLRNIAHFTAGAILMGLFLTVSKGQWMAHINALNGFTQNVTFLVLNIPLGAILYFGYLKIFQIDFHLTKTSQESVNDMNKSA